MASITDKLTRGTDSATGRPIIATLAAPGKVVGAPSITLSGSTNWSTTTPVYIALYTTTAAGIKDPTSQTDWKATLSGTTLSNMTLTGGTDRTYAAGAYVEITFTSAWAKDLYDALNTSMNADGSLKTTAVQTALNLGTSSLNGWNALGYAPNTVVYNGNRSYTLTFNGVDLTPTLSAGMRLRTTRTVAAPTQSTSLNGTSQYYSKTSPAGMTFTNNFVAGAWVKLSAYPSVSAMIISRTPVGQANGWDLLVNTSGQVQMTGRNGAGNATFINTYQSIPLNKWVHVAAQLDMSSATVTGGTANYVMIDGVDVPIVRTTAGTGPATLVQSGDLVVGAITGGTLLFPGKIAQAFVTSAKVTQATIQSNYYAQSISPTETNLISAYSFNNTLNDLNTTNANNLTANGSAVATNTDAPFGGQAGGAISPTLDYAILQSSAFSTNTTAIVQVPEGCTIPTIGGVAAVVYSSNGKPYGMPTQRGKWRVTLQLNAPSIFTATSGVWSSGATNGSFGITLPVGEWRATYDLARYGDAGATIFLDLYSSLSTSNSSESDISWTVGTRAGVGSGAVYHATQHTRSGDLSVTTQAMYYVLCKHVRSDAAATGSPGLNSVTGSTSVVYADNAYL